MKRSQVIMVAAAAIILGLFLSTYTTHPEPRYEGRSLTQWSRLYQLSSSGSSVESNAADAVRHIGTNALPFLVTWIREAQQMSPHRQGLFAFVWRWPPDAPGREFLLESIGGRQFRADRARDGFAILREAARDALPDLRRMATQGETRSARLAIEVLPYLGRDGLQPLFTMITNTTVPFWTRLRSVTSLNEVQGATNAHSAITLLIACLYDPDPILPSEAANVLGNIHQDGDLCVPALIECTLSTNETLRLCAATSLGKFGPDARAAVPALTKLLNDPSSFVRPEATNALNAIAPEVLQQTSAP